MYQVLGLKNEKSDLFSKPSDYYYYKLITMSLSREDVKKVANLARLQITENEEEEFAPQLNAILDYFEQLKELDTENVQPTTRAIEVSNITRTDTQVTYEDRESLLNSAPEREDNFFRVPKILA